MSVLLNAHGHKIRDKNYSMVEDYDLRKLGKTYIDTITTFGGKTLPTIVQFSLLENCLHMDYAIYYSVVGLVCLPFAFCYNKSLCIHYIKETDNKHNLQIIQNNKFKRIVNKMINLLNLIQINLCLLLLKKLTLITVT